MRVFSRDLKLRPFHTQCLRLASSHQLLLWLLCLIWRPCGCPKRVAEKGHHFWRKRKRWRLSVMECWKVLLGYLAQRLVSSRSPWDGWMDGCMDDLSLLHRYNPTDVSRDALTDWLWATCKHDSFEKTKDPQITHHSREIYQHGLHTVKRHIHSGYLILNFIPVYPDSWFLLLWFHRPIQKQDLFWRKPTAGWSLFKQLSPWTCFSSRSASWIIGAWVIPGIQRYAKSMIGMFEKGIFTVFKVSFLSLFCCWCLFWRIWVSRSV